MKNSASISKVRANRLKYLKLFPLFIYDIDRAEENEDQWPCFHAKMIDDLIVVSDVEEGNKLFRYGSFGKEAFARTATQVSPSVPLAMVPNQKKFYEKPYRLRSLQIDSSLDEIFSINDQTSDFERAFLTEFQETFFAKSVDDVRARNQAECQEILQESQLSASTYSIPLHPMDEDVTSTTKLIVYEHVYLLPEEALFLNHALGCLKLLDESNQILSSVELWKRFSRKDEDFPLKYAVYYRFRSAGWVVKCGLKFGCDYMLYRFGPTYNHADFCLSIENFWKNSSLSWSFIAGLNRACLNASKHLLISRVDISSSFDENQIEDFLQKTTIRTIEIQRWIPTQFQRSEESK